MKIMIAILISICIFFMILNRNKIILYCYIFACPHQVRCQHRRQYRHHQVCQLHRGNKNLFLYNKFHFMFNVYKMLGPSFDKK